MAIRTTGWELTRLIAAAQAGDEQATTEILENLAHELLPLACALGRSGAEVDILLQDSLSLVFEHLRDLRKPEALKTWARQIMVRRFLQDRRLRIRRRTVSLETASSLAAPPPDDNLVDLRRAIARLPRHERSLLVLHYWLGLSAAECADYLEIPVGTAKSRLSATLTRLRETVGGGSSV